MKQLLLQRLNTNTGAVGPIQAPLSHLQAAPHLLPLAFHIHLSLCCFPHKRRSRERAGELTGAVRSPHLTSPFALPDFLFWPLSLRRLPDGAVLHAGQPPDVSGPAERDHLHQNPLLRHHRPGLGAPLRAVPRPAAPLQARLHPQHPHRSLSRSDTQRFMVGEG